MKVKRELSFLPSSLTVKLQIPLVAVSSSVNRVQIQVHLS